MLLVAVGLLVAVSADAGAAQELPPPEQLTLTERDDAIVGGEIAQIEEHPWQVLITDGGFFTGTFCGGVLLQNNLVLTAAHCVDEAGPATTLVHAGVFDSLDPTLGQHSWPRVVTIHPAYASLQNGSGVNDLALIELASPFTLNSQVQPIELATQAETDAAIEGLALMSGWGWINDFQQGGQFLREGQIQLIADVDCGFTGPQSNWFAGVLASPATQLCSYGASTGQSTCDGDSGGPATVRVNGQSRLVGIVSFGWGLCSELNTVFTEVAAFAPWIASMSPSPVADPSAPVSFSGVVWNDLDQDGARDSGEPGIANATIELVKPTFEIGPGEPVTAAISGTDGTWSIDGLPSGLYRLRLATAGEISLGVDNDFFFDEDAPFLAGTGGLSTAPGESVTGIDAGVIVGTATIDGVIWIDEDGDGVQGATEPLFEPSAGQAIQVTNLDTNLVVSTIDLVSATWSVTIPAGGYRWDLIGFDDVAIADRPDPRPPGAVVNDFFPTERTRVVAVGAGAGDTFGLGVLPGGVNGVTDAGDANCDGRLDLRDGRAAALAAIGVLTLTSQCPLDTAAQAYRPALDVDGDGVSLRDARSIAQCAIGISTDFC